MKIDKVIDKLKRWGFEFCRAIPEGTRPAALIVLFLRRKVKYSEELLNELSLLIDEVCKTKFERKRCRILLRKKFALARRAKYYSADNLRRQRLAKDRRRQGKRRTLSSAPTPEEVRQAWKYRKDSKEAMIHLGSIMLDLDCYVERGCKWVDDKVVARDSGALGWIRCFVPELEEHYKSLMFYKSLAKKLRQATNLAESVFNQETLHPIISRIFRNSKVTITSILDILNQEVGMLKEGC